MNAPRRGGFFLMDTVIGLVIAGVLGLVLVVAITKGGQAERRLEDGATAARVAQRVMAALHQARPAPADLDGAKVEVRPAEGGTKVEGKGWVEVVVNYRGRHASLVGLVPQGGGR
jgi:hypothetical protein